MREKGQYPPKGLSSCSPSFLSVPTVAEVLISKQKWEPEVFQEVSCKAVKVKSQRRILSFWYSIFSPRQKGSIDFSPKKRSVFNIAELRRERSFLIFIIYEFERKAFTFPTWPTHPVS